MKIHFQFIHCWSHLLALVYGVLITALYYCTSRPVGMHLDLDTNMRLVGKRFPYLATYQVSPHHLRRELVINYGCVFL